jgi:hypothetical protein
VNNAIIALFTCSTVQWIVEAWYTVQWTVYHATLFTEQCTNLWIESRARKHHFSAFHLLAFRTQFMVGPCTVNRFFFFVNQTFASCVFDKTQTLTRSQMYSKCSGVGNNSERKEKIRKEKKRERKMEGKVSIQLKSQILYITCIIFLNNFNFHAVFFLMC